MKFSSLLKNLINEEFEVALKKESSNRSSRLSIKMKIVPEKHYKSDETAQKLSVLINHNMQKFFPNSYETKDIIKDCKSEIKPVLNKLSKMSPEKKDGMKKYFNLDVDDLSSLNIKINNRDEELYFPKNAKGKSEFSLSRLIDDNLDISLNATPILNSFIMDFDNIKNSSETNKPNTSDTPLKFNKTRILDIKFLIPRSIKDFIEDDILNIQNYKLNILKKQLNDGRLIISIQDNLPETVPINAIKDIMIDKVKNMLSTFGVNKNIIEKVKLNPNHFNTRGLTEESPLSILANNTSRIIFTLLSKDGYLTIIPYTVKNI